MIIKLATVAVLVFTVGLHWALLQTAAWTGMVLTYSRDASFREAVSKTFDGQHPCALCKAVKQAKATERKESQLQAPGKLTLFLSPLPPVLGAPPPAEHGFAPCAALLSFLADPPHPPPRAA